MPDFAMKVAICHNNGEQPFSARVKNRVSLHYFSEFDQFIKAGAAIFIDHSFNPADPLRVAALQQLLPATILINEVAGDEFDFPPAFIRYNGWNGFTTDFLELATANRQLPESVKVFAESLGLNYLLAPATAGLIRPRVLAMIINEAYLALEEGVSSAADIDLAMKLGTNYPYGPFEWAAKIGLPRIVALLNKLAINNTRYLPAQTLQAAAQQALWRKSF
jgi:3-hydroxybutyryl-CoA dehydrogenase